MFLFFLFITLANFSLGYWAAVKYHNLLFPAQVHEMELVRPVTSAAVSTPPFSIDASQMPLLTREPPLVAEALPVVPAAPPPKPVEVQAPTPAPVAAPVLRPLVQEQPPMPVQEAAPRVIPAAVEETPQIPVEDFMQGLHKFRAQLAALDKRVQECSKTPDSRDIQVCVDEFWAANNQYLEQTQEAADLLQQRVHGESESMASVRQTVQQAIITQAEEVRRTESELSQLDVEGDLQASCETLLRNTTELNSGSEKLCGEVEAAQEQWEEEVQQLPVEEANLIDELTQIPSRAAFDLELQQFCQSGKDFSLAVIDLDHCEALNQEHGRGVVDAVLKALAQVIAASARGEVRAARYLGQQFAVLYPEHSAEDSSLAGEQIRQIVEKTRFCREGIELPVTVSVVLLQRQPGDQTTAIESRIQEAMLAAKNFGSNRTFQFRGGDVEPLLPAELEIKSNLYEV